MIAAAAPPRIYDLDEMPRVDAHVHIPFAQAPDDKGPITQSNAHEAADAFIKIMDDSKVTVCVNLSGNREMVDAADIIHDTWKSRILFTPAAWDVRKGLWWSEEDLPKFKEAGCAGIKIWVQYRKGFTEESIQTKIGRQGEVGLPLIGLHIANPQEGKWDHPDYWEYIEEAEGVVRAHPDVTFIMAHGFWLMNNDKTLDVLAKYFDEFPLLNVDLSAVFQYWTPPQPTHDKLREFIIRYQDRLLFGTDGNPKYSTPEHYANPYKILETDETGLKGFFSGSDITGLKLPIEVLNRIYYWNAARLIPRVGEALSGLGYEV